MPLPIQAPADYVPLVALSFGSMATTATAIDAGNPLPTSGATARPATSTPLTGSTVVTAAPGPFAPQLARPIVVTLWGTWNGTAQLLRSVDGGTTKLPITYADGSARGSWSGNVNAAVTEETEAAASYYLSITLSSGTVSYRIAQ